VGVDELAGEQPPEILGQRADLMDRRVGRR
jgi:hypothetical protein